MQQPRRAVVPLGRGSSFRAKESERMVIFLVSAHRSEATAHVERDAHAAMCPAGAAEGARLGRAVTLHRCDFLFGDRQLAVLSRYRHYAIDSTLPTTRAAAMIVRLSDLTIPPFGDRSGRRALTRRRLRPTRSLRHESHGLTSCQEEPWDTYRTRSRSSRERPPTSARTATSGLPKKKS